MPHEWSNWSGSLTFNVNALEKPRDDEDVSKLVHRALDEGRIVRVAGAGHSSSPLVETEDMLISLERFQGLVCHDVDEDKAQGEATIRTGMTIHAVGGAFHKVGLAMHNTGDVDVQTLVGAVGTGTHGTGKRLQNLASILIGVRMVTGTGKIIEKRIEDDPAFFRAARVSLGALGIMTEIRVRLLPTFQLHRREQCTTIDVCLAHLDDLIEHNRNFDFYWYPRSDEAKLRTLNEVGKEPIDIPDAALAREEIGWSHNILPRKRELKFDEMEYVLPAEAGPDCFREVRERVKAKHRKHVGWRVLYRTIAADDAYLSPMSGRESVTISLQQNNTLPFWEYFKDIEPIFRAHGGRPHWGKKHTLRAADLRPLYPEWDTFLAVRERMDPHGVFLSSYLRELLIDA